MKQLSGTTQPWLLTQLQTAYQQSMASQTAAIFTGGVQTTQTQKPKPFQFQTVKRTIEENR